MLWFFYNKMIFIIKILRFVSKEMSVISGKMIWQFEQLLIFGVDEKRPLVYNRKHTCTTEKRFASTYFILAGSSNTP